MSGAARVVMQPDGSGYLTAPYVLRDLIKTLPSFTRRWEPALHVWVIDALVVTELIDMLRSVGVVVAVIGETKKPPPRNDPPPRRGPVNTWATDLLAAAPPHLRDAVFKALSRVLHPDVGGDTVLMQQLNAARDRAGTR